MTREDVLRNAGFVQATVHSDLLDIESALQGAVEQVTCQVMGKTFVFEPIDALWEAWVEQYSDEFQTLEGVRRDPTAARVAACMVGMINAEGDLVPVTEMFRMPEGDKDIDEMDRTLYASGNPIFREQWARKQLLHWLRSGSSRTGRSGQNGDLVFKLYQLGARVAMRKQAEKLGKIDPFFGLPASPEQTPAAPESDGSGSGGKSEATSSPAQDDS